MRILQAKETGGQHGVVKWSDTIRVPPRDLRAITKDTSWSALEKRRIADAIQLEGWGIDNVFPDLGLVRLKPHPNLVVNVGVQRALDKLFNRNGPPAALQTIGVDNGTVNPTSVFLSSTNGDGSSGGSTQRRLVAFDSTPTRAGNVITALGTFTEANWNMGTAAMKRLFFSAAAAGTTDANGDLYSMTNVFTIDLSIFPTWSQTFGGTVTGTGS